MDTMLIIWLCAVIVFIIIEASTSQMVCIWFAASALVTLIAALFNAPLWAQLVIFVICAAALLILTRPFVKRVMKGPRARTNADRTIGASAIVIREINNDMAEGQVRVLNQIWTARSFRGNNLLVDTKVVVRSIEGVKLIVEDIKEDS